MTPEELGSMIDQWETERSQCDPEATKADA
jgi:hypothetical protein